MSASADHCRLFTPDELAIHIVDTLVNHQLVARAQFQQAVEAVKWELNAQQAMERIGLKRADSTSAGA